MIKCNDIISIDEYINHLNNGRLYEGYVENLGYAYYESGCIPTDSVRKYHTYYQNCYACKLEVSTNTMKKHNEIPKIAKKNNNTRKSKQVLASALMVSGVLLADDVTVIGAVDDIVIPFVLAGGCLIALICYIFEGSEGSEGNAHYPGPWVSTEPAPFSPQATPPEPPPLLPPEIPPGSGGIGLVVGAAMLLENHDKTTNPYKNNTTSHSNTYATPDSHFFRDTMRMDSLKEERLREFSDMITRDIIQVNDATKVEVPKIILTYEINK